MKTRISRISIVISPDFWNKSIGLAKSLTKNYFSLHFSTSIFTVNLKTFIQVKISCLLTLDISLLSVLILIFIKQDNMLNKIKFLSKFS